MTNFQIKKNAKIYIDLNHLREILSQSKQEEYLFEFVEKFSDRIHKHDLNILDIVCFGNFDNASFKKNNIQTELNLIGIKTMFQPDSIVTDGSHIIVEATRDLYEENVDTFVFFSRLTSLKPLLKIIKLKGKEMILSDQKSFLDKDRVFAKEKFYEIGYFIKKPDLEEVNTSKSQKLKETIEKTDISKISFEEKMEIIKIYDFFIQSPLSQKFEETKKTEDAITLVGFIKHYLQHNSGVTKEYLREKIFKAHKMNYLEIYLEDESSSYYLKKSSKRN